MRRVAEEIEARRRLGEQKSPLAHISKRFEANGARGENIMGLFTFAEKTDKPKFKKNKEEGCVVSASIEIPEPLVQNEKHNVLLWVQEQAKIPGFRPGKAPMAMVEAHYPDTIRERILNRIAEKFVPDLIKELNLVPVTASTITNVDWNKSMKLEVQIEIAPQVDPKDYSKISVSYKKRAVTDEILSTELDKLRDAHSRLEPSEEEVLGNQHYAVISYTASQNGKPLPKLKNDSELVDMSSDQLIEGLSSGLLGMKKGETKEIKVKFREKDTLLNVTLVEIKKKVLPSLDDEFAKDMGLESLGDLKKNLKDSLEQEYSKQEEDEIRREIEKALLKSNSIPVPPTLVEHEAERFIESLEKQSRRSIPETDLEKLKKEIRPQVEDNLRLSYIFLAIADKEKLDMTEEDYQKELEEGLKVLKSDVEKEERRKFFERNKAGLARIIRERKARLMVREKAVVKEG